MRYVGKAIFNDLLCPSCAYCWGYAASVRMLDVCVLVFLFLVLVVCFLLRVLIFVLTGFGIGANKYVARTKFKFIPFR